MYLLWLSWTKQLCYDSLIDAGLLCQRHYDELDDKRKTLYYCCNIHIFSHWIGAYAFKTKRFTCRGSHLIWKPKLPPHTIALWCVTEHIIFFTEHHSCHRGCRLLMRWSCSAELSNKRKICNTKYSLTVAHNLRMPLIIIRPHELFWF